MKPPKNRNGSASGRSYHFRPSDWRQQPPHPQFRDKRPAAPAFDAACWFESATGAAIEIRSIADHHEDGE